MAVADAKRFYLKGTGEPADGYISADDALSAVDQTYADLAQKPVAVGDLADGPGTASPPNGYILRYDAAVSRWTAVPPFFSSIRFRGIVNSSIDLSALTGSSNGDYAVVRGTATSGPQIYIYNGSLSPPAWEQIGGLGSSQSNYSTVFWGTAVSTSVVPKTADVWLVSGPSLTSSMIRWGGTAPSGAAVGELWFVTSGAPPQTP